MIIVINNIARIEHQKITYFLGSTNNQQLKFRTKNWVEINNYANGKDDPNDQIRLKTTKLESSLCDYSDAYILVKGITEEEEQMQQQGIS